MAPLRKKSQRKNPPASSSSAPIHPPYFQMISEALTSLKDRNGSSQAAIAKFLQDNYGEQLPAKFDKILTAQLKKSVNSQKLVQIRNAYKICPSEKKKKVSGDDSGESEDEEAPAGKKMKALGQVKTPEAMEKKAAKGRMKRLSQIHTPDALKKSKKKKRKV